MYDTALDSKLDRIREITDRLADINLGRPTVVNMYEEPDLLQELGRLNREIGIEMMPAAKLPKGETDFWDSMFGEVLKVLGVMIIVIGTIATVVIALVLVFHLMVTGLSSYPAP